MIVLKGIVFDIELLFLERELALVGRASKFSPLKSSSESVTYSKSDSWADKMDESGLLSEKSGGACWMQVEHQNLAVLSVSNTVRPKF